MAQIVTTFYACILQVTSTTHVHDVYITRQQILTDWKLVHVTKNSSAIMQLCTYAYIHFVIAGIVTALSHDFNNRI